MLLLLRPSSADSSSIERGAVGQVERRDDLPAEPRDAGEARGDLVADALEERASRERDRTRVDLRGAGRGHPL